VPPQVFLSFKRSGKQGTRVNQAQNRSLAVRDFGLFQKRPSHMSCGTKQREIDSFAEYPPPGKPGLPCSQRMRVRQIRFSLLTRLGISCILIAYLCFVLSTIMPDSPFFFSQSLPEAFSMTIKLKLSSFDHFEVMLGMVCLFSLISPTSFPYAPSASFPRAGAR
jgi:hypothetical protein